MIDKNKGDHTSVSIEEVEKKGREGAYHWSLYKKAATWPGSDPVNIGFPLGYTTSDIDINEIMWHFFEKNKNQE